MGEKLRKYYAGVQGVGTPAREGTLVAALTVPVSFGGLGGGEGGFLREIEALDGGTGVGGF